MNRPRLVALCGPAGSGKSTVARQLEQVLLGNIWAPQFKRLRFAGPLKAMLLALGLTREQVDGEDKEKPCALLGGKTSRWAMQTLGTQWGRELIDEDLWVRAALAQAERDMSAGFSVVIDDCRFSNEALAVAAMGGTVFRISRAGGYKHSNVHASEVGVPGNLVHYIISNNGTPQQAADDILTILKHRP